MMNAEDDVESHYVTLCRRYFRIYDIDGAIKTALVAMCLVLFSSFALAVFGILEYIPREYVIIGFVLVAISLATSVALMIWENARNRDASLINRLRRYAERKIRRRQQARHRRRFRLGHIAQVNVSEEPREVPLPAVADQQEVVSSPSESEASYESTPRGGTETPITQLVRGEIRASSAPVLRRAEHSLSVPEPEVAIRRVRRDWEIFATPDTPAATSEAIQQRTLSELESLQIPGAVDTLSLRSRHPLDSEDGTSQVHLPWVLSQHSQVLGPTARDLDLLRQTMEQSSPDLEGPRMPRQIPQNIPRQQRPGPRLEGLEAMQIPGGGSPLRVRWRYAAEVNPVRRTGPRNPPRQQLQNQGESSQNSPRQQTRY